MIEQLQDKLSWWILARLSPVEFWQCSGFEFYAMIQAMEWRSGKKINKQKSLDIDKSNRTISAIMSGVINGT